MKVDKQMRALYAMCANALVQGHATLEGAIAVGFNTELPAFTVGYVAKVANIHPQTLRQYDRSGLIVPQRTIGGARRYSLRDIARLLRGQELSRDYGVSLSAVGLILSLEEENHELRRRIQRLQQDGNSVFTANSQGSIVEMVTSGHIRRQQRRWKRSAAQLPSREQAASQDNYPHETSMIVWSNAATDACELSDERADTVIAKRVHSPVDLQDELVIDIEDSLLEE